MPLRWSDLHAQVLEDRPLAVADGTCRLCGEPLPVFCVEETHSDLCEECEELDAEDEYEA